MNDPWNEIKQEIEKHPHELWVEFMKLFPCERKNYFLPIPKKVFKIEPLDPNKKVILKYRQVGPTTMMYGHPHPWLLRLPPPRKEKYVICADNNDFWSKWKRFQKLKLFL